MVMICCAVLSIVATAPSDYITSSGITIFRSRVGDGATACLTIPIVDDNLSEGNETFTVMLELRSMSVTLGNTITTTVTIIDDESMLIAVI